MIKLSDASHPASLEPFHYLYMGGLHDRNLSHQEHASRCQRNLLRGPLRSRRRAEPGGVVAVTVQAGIEPPAPHAPEAAPAEPRRLWLHASLASSPGAYGFYRTARTEPLGDNLRLLLDYESPGAIPPVTGVPQALSGTVVRVQGFMANPKPCRRRCQVRPRAPAAAANGLRR